ncbi:transglutaminase-like domain-containing protein [Corallococcus sp. Z5C101001]|uniref:transglutaminase-like domain-containing protein n=1 Tax=Corallococcus sp. Z5C101001 TaxID=2596829 RepID=UPI00117F8F14|nr:transglutaminase-like domain-containing protein [Corallococcus sp. Z5C101001]TSC34153.1 transglutaminase domain-containing protein [Corallococcus sp. Z5C101001]
MALAPLSRSSVASPCAQRSPEAAQAGQRVVVKVVNADGSPLKTLDAQKQPRELAALLKQLGLSPQSLQKTAQGTGGACQKQAAHQQFQQAYQRDSFEPAKSQKPSPTPPPAQAQNTPAPAQPQNAAAPAQGAKGPSSGKSTDQVAQDIAKEATTWKYDYTGGKTWDAAMNNAQNFDTSKAGVCVDMAIEAEQRFEAQGVDAHVVFGKTAEGDHAWVEFKDDQGGWQAFDPTAAACTKKADDAITPYDGGPYHYQGVTETHEAVA